MKLYFLLTFMSLSIFSCALNAMEESKKRFHSNTSSISADLVTEADDDRATTYIQDDDQETAYVQDDYQSNVHVQDDEMLYTRTLAKQTTRKAKKPKTEHKILKSKLFELCCLGTEDFQLLAGLIEKVGLKGDGFGRTPLHTAAMKNHVQIARFLISKGADPNARSNDHKTPLDCCFIKSLDYTEMRKLLEPLTSASKRPIERDHNKNLVIDESDQSTQSSSEKALEEDKEKMKNLVEALKKFKKEAVLQAINRQGFNVNARLTNAGDTLLHLAAYFGVLTFVCKLVLEKNADVNVKTLQSSTPLHLASLMGHTEIVKLLLERNAEIVQDNLKLTPLDIAKNNEIKNLIRAGLQRRNKLV